MVNVITVTDPPGAASACRPLYANPLTVMEGLVTRSGTCVTGAAGGAGDGACGAVVDDAPPGEEPTVVAGSEVVDAVPGCVDVGDPTLVEVDPGVVDEVGSVHVAMDVDVEVGSVGHGADPAASTAGLAVRSGVTATAAHATRTANSRATPPVPCARGDAVSLSSDPRMTSLTLEFR